MREASAGHGFIPLSPICLVSGQVHQDLCSFGRQTAVQCQVCTSLYLDLGSGSCNHMGVFAEHIPECNVENFCQSSTLLACHRSTADHNMMACALSHHVGATGVLEKSMGVLLVDFLRLFGRSLNNDDVGISCSKGGYFYNKLDAQKEQPMRPYMLSVEDPADPDNDLSRGSWNFLKVFCCVTCRFPTSDVFSTAGDTCIASTNVQAEQVKFHP